MKSTYSTEHQHLSIRYQFPDLHLFKYILIFVFYLIVVALNNVLIHIYPSLYHPRHVVTKPSLTNLELIPITQFAPMSSLGHFNLNFTYVICYMIKEHGKVLYY